MNLATLTPAQVAQALSNGGYETAEGELLGVACVGRNARYHVYALTFRGEDGPVERGQAFIENRNGKLMGEF